MRFWFRLSFCALAVLAGIAVGGCTPGQGQSDDEKEPHFVLGMSKVNAMDYQGAVKAFEESLEVNPQSAAAHFELGMLYEEKVPDPASAIYHYERYLKLNPSAGNADIIKRHIDACKQRLAADVLGLPSSSAAQQQLQKLAEQNRELQQRVDQLQETVKQWNAYYASQQAVRNTAPTQNNFISQPAAPATPNATQPTPTPPQSIQPRTHTVVAGETSAGIARKYGVKLSAMGTVNPGVNLSRIHPGQVLNLPPP
jgi:LysM repeat protein